MPPISGQALYLLHRGVLLAVSVQMSRPAPQAVNYGQLTWMTNTCHNCCQSMQHIYGNARQTLDTLLHTNLGYSHLEAL